jgi:hypothetical protein
MRTLTLALSAMAAIAGTPMTLHAADVYPPAYGAAPPPAYRPPPVAGYVPPVVYGSPPAVAYGAVPIYPRAPGFIAAPEGPAYAVPGPVYQPGDEYAEQPVLVDDSRYYRKCWWEFGYRRCFLRHKAWFW